MPITSVLIRLSNQETLFKRKERKQATNPFSYSATILREEYSLLLCYYTQRRGSWGIKPLPPGPALAPQSHQLS